MSNELYDERVSFYSAAKAFIKAQEKHLGKLISENSELKKKVDILGVPSGMDINDWLKNLCINV